jgi:uncharacterized damage-inducible protein DinB
MKPIIASTPRRAFIKAAATMATTFTGLRAFAMADPIAEKEELMVIGPMTGYSPQVGTLVSMLNYNRHTVIEMVKGMSKAELDHLHDANANTIASLILHLGATEKFYQINTFEGRDDFNDAEKKVWGAAMNLGEEARRTIKGQEAAYYLDIIKEVREKTLTELKAKDDSWLAAVDPKWSTPGNPLNTYWKWFHVCEHESNHRGQIAWLKSRLPGAKPAKD